MAEDLQDWAPRTATALAAVPDLVATEQRAAAKLAEAEARDRTPIKTGALHNSITATVSRTKGDVTLQATDEAAPFIEFGTRYVDGVHMLRDGLDVAIDTFEVDTADALQKSVL